MGSRIALGLAVVMAAFGAMVGTANAAASILPSETCCTFQAGPFEQGRGEIAILDNSATTAVHDLISTQKGPDGKFLFAAAGAAGGQTSPVNGTQYLNAGSYSFICQIHGPSMSGTLTVNATGTAVPRPTVRVSFVNQKLKQLRRSGVRVKLTATSASAGVAVTAKKGNVVIGSKRGLILKAGQTRTLTLPLTKGGRKAVSRGKVVQISLKATVNYGKPSSAIRKVR